MVQFFLFAAGDDDLSAQSGQFMCGAATNTGAAAGDDDDIVGKGRGR
jgi:hypothetical protein